MKIEGFYDQLYFIEKGKQYVIIWKDVKDIAADKMPPAMAYPMGQLLCECSLLDTKEIVTDILSYEGCNDELTEANIEKAFYYYNDVFCKKYTYIQARMLMVQLFNFVNEYLEDYVKYEKNLAVFKNQRNEEKDYIVKLLTNTDCIVDAFLIGMYFYMVADRELKECREIIGKQIEERTEVDIDKLYYRYIPKDLADRQHIGLENNDNVKILECLKNRHITTFFSIVNDKVVNCDNKTISLEGIQVIKGIKNIETLLSLEVYNLVYHKIEICRCEHCDRIFIPTRLEKTRYCGYPDVKNPSKLCREVVARKKVIEHNKQDIIKVTYARKYNKLNMYANRHPEKLECQDKAQLFSKEFRKMAAKRDNGDITKDDLLMWIENFE